MNKIITTKQFIENQFKRNYVGGSEFTIVTRRNVLIGVLILYYKNNDILYYPKQYEPYIIHSSTLETVVKNYYHDKRRSTRT